MRRLQRAVSLLVLGLSLAGCARAPGDAAAPSAIASSPSASDGTPPIDVSIPAVSRSNPSTGAQDALDACGLTDYHPHNGAVLFDTGGIRLVSGMGLVPEAQMAHNYLPAGTGLDAGVTSPAWVITTSGVIEAPGVAPLQDPFCIVLDGDWADATWYGGNSLVAPSTWSTPPPQPAPILRLPPLAP